MFSGARLGLPLAGALVGVVAATAFRPTAPPATSARCPADHVQVQASPLHDVRRAGAASPAAAVEALLATGTVPTGELGDPGLAVDGLTVRLFDGAASVGTASTYALPAGGYAVDLLALCLPSDR